MAIAVVHLVRHANGPAPVDAFLSSYERHDAGCEHELVLLCKGFPDTAALDELRRRTRGLAAHELTVSDVGFDIGAYIAAARELSHERLCFVNSFSEILHPGWLRALDAALDDPRVGASGATGSWASWRSLALSVMKLPNGYRGTLGDPRQMTPALRSTSTAPAMSRPRRLLRAACALPADLAAYPGFPAPHLRTNAFAIGRELLLSLRTGALDDKRASYGFEAGHRSLTAQLRASDLATLVVGCDGVGRAHEAWPDAEVFWQGTQRDLLVADNQTRTYEHASATVREALARYAWGPRARPG